MISAAAPVRIREAIVAADPPSVQAVSQYNLAGHSGASIVLYSQGLHSFVRKTAASPAASPRLKSQADKQHAMWMSGLPVPRVLGQGFDTKGRATFDMAYIPGRTVADAVSDAAPFDTAMVAKAVERLAWLSAMGTGDLLPPHLFENKISQIAGAAVVRAMDLETRDEVRGCAEHLMRRDWSGIPQTPCHGDLTLENMLLTTGKSIAFIDCDEAFASSYWLDFGKLFQDIDGHWCIRRLYDTEVPPVRRVNALQKLEQLGGRLRALAASLAPALPGHLPQLAALGLFRAIPYTQSQALTLFLCRRIEHLLRA